ncbi:MAG: SagB family peptide dehydrogenase [Candidatus Caldarchaeum sp.]
MGSSVKDYREALKFHENTKHSYVSVRTVFHRLDWGNRPYPFKIYEGLPTIALPRTIPKPGLHSITCLNELDRARDGSLDIGILSSLLFFTAGITRAVRYVDGVHYFRAAPATGALYPTEVYVVAGDVGGLAEGVYHFSPYGFNLTILRSGDFRSFLAKYSHEDVGMCQASLVFTSIGWRNAWKYRERSYRHWFWDSGTMVANLLAVCRAFGLQARVVTGFVDEKVNSLVAVDGVKEAAIIIVPLGLSQKKPPETDEVAVLTPRVKPLSKRETVYKLVEEIHKASSITTVEELQGWREKAVSAPPSAEPAEDSLSINPVEDVGPPLWEVILRRGSTRRFSRQPISFPQLSTILKASSARFVADFNNPLTNIYLIVNAVNGMKPGAYFFDGERLKLLKAGEFRRVSGYLCLEQELGSDAAAVLFITTPLENVLQHLGNRGYRVVQLEGGIRAGLAYLAAYAVGVGATGLTFYDDDVKEFFSPHASGKENVIVVAVGVPAYKAKPGKIILGVESEGDA